jgi:hypothetical protein
MIKQDISKFWGKCGVVLALKKMVFVMKMSFLNALELYKSKHPKNAFNMFIHY